MILTALADNCPLIRRALKELFSKRGEHQLVWHAGTTRELFQLLPRKRPHVLILEPAVAGDGGGLHLVERLHSQYNRLPILIYTGSGHQDIAVSCMQLGAAGFLAKDSPEDELFAAIQRIADGHLYLNSNLMEHVAMLHLSHTRSEGASSISPREQQVLEGLNAGLQVKSIADKMSCSSKTVSTHRARLLQKLGLHSNADLYRYAQNVALLKQSSKRRVSR